MSGPTIYRSRWGVCDGCGCALIVERNDARGVPHEDEWHAFADCLVCGSGVISFSADEDTIADRYWRMGHRAGAMDDRVESWEWFLLLLERHTLKGQPIWDEAMRIAEEVREGGGAA